MKFDFKKSQNVVWEITINFYKLLLFLVEKNTSVALKYFSFMKNLKEKL